MVASRDRAIPSGASGPSPKHAVYRISLISRDEISGGDLAEVARGEGDGQGDGDEPGEGCRR